MSSFLGSQSLSPANCHWLRLIQEIIQGVEGAARKGRGQDKIFLYDIVNNTRSGLDVDKIGETPS